MILAHQDIIDAVGRGEISISNFDMACVESASYDMKMGDQAVTASAKKLIDVLKEGFIIIEPGDFGIVITNEMLTLDDQHVGRFGLKSKYSRKGLIATIGPQIDAGYSGKLIVGLTNLSPNPVVISHNEKLFTVEFHRLKEPTTKPYNGPYQGKDRIDSDDIEEIINSSRMTMPEVYTTLQSLSQNVEGLTSDVKSLASHMKYMPWVIGVSFAALSIVVTLISIFVK